MSIAGQENVPAAWYPDHGHPGQLRWWDGYSWTGEVRPAIVIVPEVVTPPPLLEAHRSPHMTAKPAQGFGHATPDQLRSWPPPSAHQRNQLPTSVNEVPRQWSTSTRDDATNTWFDHDRAPIQFVPRLADFEPAHAVGEFPDFFADADESTIGDTLENTIELLTKTRLYSDLSSILDEEQASARYQHSDVPVEQPSTDFQDPFQDHQNPFQDHQNPFQDHQNPFQDHQNPFQAHQDPFQAHQAHQAQDQFQDWPQGSDQPWGRQTSTSPGLTRRELRGMVGPLTTDDQRH